jgi:hypothetical protein
MRPIQINVKNGTGYINVDAISSLESVGKGLVMIFLNNGSKIQIEGDLQEIVEKLNGM